MKKEKTEHPILACRRSAVPLVVYESPDNTASIKAMRMALKGPDVPIISWDICNGWQGLNPAGEEYLKTIGYDPQAHQLPESLTIIGANAEKKLLAFLSNVQRFIERDGVIQGIWNLRDKFKSVGATCILVGPAFKLPVELSRDFVSIVEPLPDAEALAGIVETVVTDIRAAGVPIPEDYGSGRCVEILLGLSSFAAEQTIAMSCTKQGIDFDGLWDRKVKMIEQTPGLSVWRGKETFDDIGGCSNVKGYVEAVLRGRNAPLGIAFADEIEKAFAGAAGDLSGVSQDTLGCVLSFMQDKQACGMIFVGPPGAAKSAVAKAAGQQTGIPTIAVDFGAMKASLVGESEARLRQALQVIDAVTQSRTLFIATCNSLAVLPPELKRRFNLGTFFFDLPTPAERKQIWKIKRKKYEINSSDDLPDDTDWTGAEIEQCASVAWRLNKPLKDAAQFVVPVAKAAADKIAKLRSGAHGVFINASEPGVYRMPEKQVVGRMVDFN